MIVPPAGPQTVDFHGIIPKPHNNKKRPDFSGPCPSGKSFQSYPLTNSLSAGAGRNVTVFLAGVITR